MVCFEHEHGLINFHGKTLLVQPWWFSSHCTRLNIRFPIRTFLINGWVVLTIGELGFGTITSWILVQWFWFWFDCLIFLLIIRDILWIGVYVPMTFSVVIFITPTSLVRFFSTIYFKVLYSSASFPLSMVAKLSHKFLARRQ